MEGKKEEKRKAIIIPKNKSNDIRNTARH
uniref:Uncharacterized protein n=1 Tax=Anguilla anguilla TaxID=7936 RepID=A0A0E9W1G8_ANGAN